jgi:general L-amino acid transport system substrate-binding protein
MIRMTVLALGAALLAGPALGQTTAAAGPTLAATRAKGVVDCGGHPGAPGFGVTDSRGVYQGLEADTCRAVAAAIFGDGGRVASPS